MDWNMMKNVLPLFLVCLLTFAVVGCGSSPERIDPSGDRKVTTMEADYAEIVIDRLSRKHPEAKPFIKVLKMKSMISRGKFEAVLEAIGK